MLDAAFIEQVSDKLCEAVRDILDEMRDDIYALEDVFSDGDAPLEVRLMAAQYIVEAQSSLSIMASRIKGHSMVAEQCRKQGDV